MRLFLIISVMTLSLMMFVRGTAVPIETCSIEKVANAPKGYKCQVETASGKASFWRVEVKTTSGEKVLKDVKSGLLVSDILEGYTQHQAEKICTNPASQKVRGNLTSVRWRLPTGYPKRLNGQYGFPKQNSDFETLIDNGLRKVMDTSKRYFWSSSIDPEGSLGAYGFNGIVGNIGYYLRSFKDGSIVCVGR